MSNISGHVYYAPNNILTSTVGIPNVPVVLRDPVLLVGAVALTDANGAFVFTNVPNGNYQIIEAWGTLGGIATPVNYLTAQLPMATMPTEAEPPLSALPVAPPALADMLMAISPNLLNVTVNGDVTALAFYDAPVGSKPVAFNGIQLIGPNLVTAADNGSFGTVAAGSAVNTIPPVAPYPTVTPGLPYQATPEITDGSYSIVNIRRKVNTTFAWWNLSDHETMLETGRFMFVNGDSPSAVLFTDTIAVTPNTYYTFTGWGLNLLDIPGVPPRFSIQVLGSDGSQLGYQLFNSIDYTPIPVWYQGGFLFNSGNYSSVTVNVSSEAAFSRIGNDYAVDELRMFETELINLLELKKTMTPSTIYTTNGVGHDVLVSVTITNTSAFAAPDVIFQDILDTNLQFVPGSVQVNGSSVGYVTADPNIGFPIGDMAAGQVNTVTFHATTLSSTSIIIPNAATASYTAIENGNNDAIRNTVKSNIATVELFVRRADVAVSKSVDKAFAKPNDVLTYTLTLNNAGNVPAYNVVITDAIPLGASFVPGSLVGATGTLPTLTLNAPIGAGGTATVTYQVKIGNAVPVPNPIPNTVSLVYAYTVDPAKPLGATKTAQSNTVTTLVNEAKLSVVKSTDKIVSYIGDTITYQIAVKNTGNVPANNVVITDLLTAGTVYVPGSLAVNVPATGAPTTAIALTNPIAPGQTVSILFKATVATMPNPNPILNLATSTFTYTVDPQNPDGETGGGTSNIVRIPVFRNNFGPPINDVIRSVSLEQAALAAIANAEGAKIQRMAAMPGVTPAQLLCLNESASEMMDSMAMLEAVLKQKMGVLACQIDGEVC